MLSEGSEDLCTCTPDGTATMNSDGILTERVYESEYEITFVRVAYCQALESQ